MTRNGRRSQSSETMLKTEIPAVDNEIGAISVPARKVSGDYFVLLNTAMVN